MNKNPEANLSNLALNKKLDEIKTRHAQRTPGPYMWDVNTKTKHAFLISKIGLRNIVLDFWRWGTNSAGPAFRDFTGGILRRVEHFAVPRMAHHPDFDMYIDHPDAVGLEKSWEDVEELLKIIDYLLPLTNRLRYALEAVERQVKDPHNRGYKTGTQQCRLMDYILDEIVRPAVEEVRGGEKGERLLGSERRPMK